MFRFLFVVLEVALAVTVSSILQAAEARAKVPATAAACSYVLLDGTASTASKRLTWKIPDPDVLVYRSGDGRQIVIYVPSPRSLCLNLEAVDSDNSTDTQLVCIKITGDGVTPAPVIPPIPVPIPDPVEPKPVVPVVPVLPAGRFLLAQSAFDQASKLTHATRAIEVPKVVAQLERLRDRIKSGEVNVGSLLSLKAGLDKLVSENKEALGPSITYWSPWGDWWASAMKALYTSSKLATAADWIAAIDETILGLKAVK